MKNRSNNPFVRLCVAVSIAISFAQTAHAATATWNGLTNGVWDLGTNWSPSGVPISTTDVIVLGPSNVTGALALKFTTGTSPTANSITFTDTAAVTLATTATTNVTLTTAAGGITTGIGLVTIGANSSATGVNMSLSAPQTWNVGFGGLTATNNITSASAFTKTGVGTLTFNSGGAGSLGGGVTLNGGTAVLDFVNLTTPTNLLTATNTLAFGGGAMAITAKTGAVTTAQTFAGTTVNANGGGLLVNALSTGGTSNVALGSITATAAGGSLLVGRSLTANTGTLNISTTSNKDATGIYGGRVLFGNGTAATGYDWATSATSTGPGTPNTLAAYAAYTAMPLTGGSASVNYSTAAGGTLSGPLAVNTLKIVGSATALALGANAMTVNSAGLLSTGSTAQTISGTAGSTTLTASNGSGTYDLVVHQYNSAGMTISAVIGDNLVGGTNPVSLVKAGTAILTLSGTNTYTGNTYISAGMLDFGATTPAGSGRNIFVAPGAIVKFATLTNALLNRLDQTTQEITVAMAATGAAATQTNNLDFRSTTGANLPNGFLGTFASNGSPGVYAGTLTPATDAYRLGGGGGGVLFMNNSAAMTGTQGLIVGSAVELIGAKTFSGDTVIRSGQKLGLSAFTGGTVALALQNSVLDTNGGGTIWLEAATSTPVTGTAATTSATFGGLRGSTALASVVTTSSGGNNTSATALASITGFTLNTGTGVSASYSGAIANFATGTTLTKSGPGTQTFSSATTAYTGLTTISGGTLVLSSTTAFASPVTVNATTTLQFSPTAAHNMAAIGAISLPGTLTYSPAGNFFQVLGKDSPNTGAVTVSGGSSVINISPGGVFAASAGGLYLDGGLKGSTALTVNATTNGFGLVLRTASSTYSGAMTVTGNPSTVSGTGSGLAIGSSTVLNSASLTINGTLELGDSTAGMGWATSGFSAVTGTTLSIDALSGSGVVVANMKTAASIRTLSVGNNNGTGSFSGVIANGTNNTLSFTKAGSGTQTLTGTNTYTGVTTITAGTLQLGNGTTGNDGTIATSSGITNTGALIYNRFGILSSSVPISGTGAVTKTGPGTQTLAGTNTYTGNTTVSGGTLNFTGMLTGNTTTSTLAYGGTAANTVVNVSNNLTLFTTTAATAANANAVYNQTAGIVNLSPSGQAFNTTNGYSYFNLTGGTVKINSGNFLITNGATATGVAYVGGTGILDLNSTSGSNGGVAFAGNGTLTVGPGGSVLRTTGGAAFYLTAFANATGTLNVANGNIDLGTGLLRMGNGATLTGINGYVNLASGTLTMGTNFANSALGANLYVNFAGGTLKASAALNSPFSTGSGVTTFSTIFGAIDNLGTAQDFTGGLTVDSNNNSVTYGNALLGATANGVKQTNIAITGAGGSGYIGAPAVTFTGGTLATNGTPASGYAVISGGAVTEIVITSPGEYTADPTVTLTGGGGTGAGVTLSALSANAIDSGLTKMNPGTLTLTATNSYAGPTTISGGTLRVDGSIAGSGTAVNIGATLSGIGTVSNLVMVNTGGSITAGNGTSGTLTLSNLTFSDSGTINIGNLANYSSSPAINTGALTLSGGPGAVTLNLGPISPGVGLFHLLQTTSGLTDATGFTLGTLPNRTVGTLQVNSGVLDYNVTSSAFPIWTGAQSSEWSTAAITNPKNWTLSGGGGATDYLEGDAVLFDDTATNYTVDISNGNMSPVTVTFSNNTNNYSLTGINGITGTTGLTKSGNASLTLTNTNTYTGTTTINAGTLMLGNGTTDGSISTSANIVNNGTLAYNRIANFSYPGVISGAGAITKSGAGSQTLTGANTYTGTTTISAGTLAAGVASVANVSGAFGNNSAVSLANVAGAGVDITGFSTRIGSLTGGGTTGGNVTLGAATLTVGGDNTSPVAYAGIISGTGVLTKNGTGTLILSGANSYSGGTNIQSGTVQVNTGGTLGATTGAVTVGTGSVGVIGTVGSLTLNTSATVGALSVVSNTATSTGADIALLTIASPGTLTASSMSTGVAGNATKTALGTSGGGTLTVNGAFTMGLAATTVTNVSIVNLSGLANFNNINATGTMAIGNNLDNAATLTLAATANTINVANLQVAVSTNNYNQGYSTLNLGASTNTLQASSIIIGQGKGQGALQFVGSGGSVSIDGTNGSGLAAITIGNATSASYIYNGDSALLLVGHNANVNAGTVVVSKIAGSTSGSPVAQVTFDTGTFNATSIQLALNTSGTGSPTGSFTVGGPTANSAATGVVNVTNNFLLAGNTNTTAGTSTGSLTINGGTVNSNTAASAAGGIFDTSTNPTGTSATALTLAGGTLNLNGGVIGGTTGTGKKNIGTLNFMSGTLQNVLQINGGAGLTKISDGTGAGGILSLTGTNSYTGDTLVSAGTLRVNSPGSLVASAVMVNGTSTLGGNGIIGGAVTVAAAAKLSPGVAAAGTLTINGGLDISAQAAGAGTLAYELNSLAGTNDKIVAGSLAIGAGVLGMNDFAFTNLGGLQAGTYKLITSGVPITGTLDSANLTGTLGTFNTTLQITGNDLELAVNPANGYATWAAINAPTGTVKDDFDGDGVSNGVEYVLGGTKLTNDLSKLPTVSATGGNFVVNFIRDQASIDGTTTLAIEVGTTLTTWPDTYAVSDSATANNPGVTVVKGSPSGFDTVTLSILQAPNATKFARLKVAITP